MLLMHNFRQRFYNRLICEIQASSNRYFEELLNLMMEFSSHKKDSNEYLPNRTK